MLAVSPPNAAEAVFSKKIFKSTLSTADIVSEVRQKLNRKLKISGQTLRKFEDKEQSNTSDLRRKGEVIIMMRSLFSGVSGLKVHQTRMDVIGNNISNVNTNGFKSSRATFSDMLSQSQRSAAAPTDGRGGINPRQIGLGVNVESIDLIFTDSSPQQTGKNTDLALSGNGLFFLKDGNNSYYTRNGAFSFDESGYYVMPGNGLRVQGWNATSDGVLNTNGTAEDIVVPVGKTMEAQSTTSISYNGNLNKESQLIERIQFNSATGVNRKDAFDAVCTGTDSDHTTSVNVDGVNVASATIYMKDGSQMTVTSGYYEVGKSVPITTLATIYDSQGGTHEVTVLIDKDPNSIDSEANATAQSTSTGDIYAYTDEYGVVRTATLTNDVYQYTDADNNTVYVPKTSVYRGAYDANNVIQPVTANEDVVYQYKDANNNTVYVPKTSVTRGVTDGTNYFKVSENTSTVYKYDNAGTTTYTTDVYAGVVDDNGTVQQLSKDNDGYYYMDANNNRIDVATSKIKYYLNNTTTEVSVADSSEVAYKYTDANGATQYTSKDNTIIYTNTGTAAAPSYQTVTVAPTSSVAYKYTDDNGDTQYVSEADMVRYTPVTTAGGTTNTEVTKGTAYMYTDIDGNTQYVGSDEVSTRTVYDNRWRVYLAPQAGEKGPAAGDDFVNKIEITESDGSTTTAIMNADDNGNTTVSYMYFNNNGTFITNGRQQDAEVTFSYANGNGSSDNTAIFSFNGLTQYSNSTTSFPVTNGNAAGVLQSLSIDGSGIINGTYTNGLVRAEAQIAIAQFNNASGLTKAGTTIYQASNNSGIANIKTVVDFGLSITSSALEMSNVDLATEFADMIITQRGFQANSKVTTVSDEMLETLVNMKR